MIHVHVSQALSLRNAMVLKVAIFHSLLDVRLWPTAARRDRQRAVKNCHSAGSFRLING